MVSAKAFQGWLVVRYGKRKGEEEADLKEKKMTRKMKGWGIYIGVLIIVSTAYNHFFMFSEVPTESMAGTIEPGDNLACTRFGIGVGEVGRYDILIFTPPDEPGMLYVKRVVGLPGETIEIKNGKVYADGVELDNSFTKGPQNRRGGMGFTRFQKGIISSWGTTGITQMTAGSGGKSMCLLQTSRQRQG